MDVTECIKITQEFQDGKINLAQAKQLLKAAGMPVYLIKETLQCK